MAMRRRRSERQELLFVTAENLPKSAGHPFYKALNRLLSEADFDRWIEDRCLRYHDNEQPRGQKSIPPGTYFRMLLVGYFEGIDSQRGIAWRCADSLSLRGFLGLALDEQSPDHSTLSLTRLPFLAGQHAAVEVVGVARHLRPPTAARRLVSASRRPYGDRGPARSDIIPPSKSSKSRPVNTAWIFRNSLPALPN